MKLRATPKRGRRLTIELENDEGNLPVVPSDELALKRILVPTDFSESSRKALHYADSLARQFGAEIVLLHVIEPMRQTPPAIELLLPASVDAVMHDEAAKHLAAWRKDLSGKISVRESVRSGAAYHEIINLAEETNTDLIVIATQGRTRLAQILVGSTAERVMRHAPCPVLVVRERERDFLETETTNRKLKGKQYAK